MFLGMGSRYLGIRLGYVRREGSKLFCQDRLGFLGMKTENTERPQYVACLELGMRVETKLRE